MDIIFGPLCGEFKNNGITMNALSNGEQVPEVGCYMHSMKERWCEIYNTLPIYKLPYCRIIKWFALMSSVVTPSFQATSFLTL